jgi:hypothetical protein
VSNVVGSNRYNPRENTWPRLEREISSRSDSIFNPRAVGHFQLLAGGFSTSLGGIGGFSGFARLPSVNTKDGNGDDDSRLFPSWRMFLAPMGVISLLWGWNRIRNNTNVLWGSVALGVGAILWMYGLVVFLNALGRWFA